MPARRPPPAGPLRAYRSLASTQALARAWADSGAPEGAVVLADHQTEGRGQRGRAWTAPPGTALLFSVVLRPRLPVARWPEIPLAAGCAVAEGSRPWPRGRHASSGPTTSSSRCRKVAGILAEGVAGTPPLVVLGIGVNVSQGEADWPPDLAGTGAIPAGLGTPVTREALLSAVLARSRHWYGSCSRRGSSRAAAWRLRGLLAPASRSPAGEGTSVDLGPGGELVVRGEDDRRPWSAARRPGGGGRALMLLAVDVGNTNVKLGVYDDRRLVASWRLTTRREQTADEYGVFTHMMLRSRGLEPSHVTEIAISSTVPAVQRTMEEMAAATSACRHSWSIPASTSRCRCGSTIRARSARPRRQGRGRRRAVRAAAHHHRLRDRDDLRVRVGRGGEFIGGAIAPGIATAAEALTARAARLFRVDLVRPPTAIGRNTVTNIQSGIVYGYAGLVDGLVARMRAEMDGAPKVVATGGLVGPDGRPRRTIDVVNPTSRSRVSGSRARAPGARRRGAAGRAGRLTRGDRAPILSQHLVADC